MRIKTWVFRGLVVIGLVMGLALPAHATLIDRGLFDDGLGSLINLVYDDDLDITWLGDANFGAGSAFDDGASSTDGRMTWDNAVLWAESLTVGSFTDWRLPEADPSCGTAFNCTTSEMGHLYYSELGNSIGGRNTSPFRNVQPPFYWSGTEVAPNNIGAWNFNFVNGVQSGVTKIANGPAWAVRSGDVSAPAVPEPSTLLLMGSGLVGLLGWNYRRAKKA